ncbi:transposase [Hydrocarboniphaga sp.]|uniref:transposase n=1 Tax=Hydrocarboniphaga sp. TaxID=2033016 RepID=UPI003D0C23C4
MARYKPVDQHLSKLLPVSFAEQIVPGTFEYALNWLVDHEIDLTVFDARYCNDEVGAAAYHPGVLLKIVLFGYARGLTSSRDIERACRENVVFMALSGDTQPHFTTIASFVAKLPDEITSVFRNVLLVCDEQGLIGKALFAVDGCKLPSNASRSLSGTRADMAKKIEKIDRAIAHMLDTHRRQDAGQNTDTLTQREQQQIETLTRNSNKLREWLATHPEKTNRKGEPLKSNITDNDSATMKTSHGVVQGYTGVAAVDAKAQVIVQASAFGIGQENGLLPEVLQALRSDFSAIGSADPLADATVLTDSGYHSEATLQRLADDQVDALIADTGFRSRDPRFAEAWQHKPIEKQRQPGEHRSKWFGRADFLYDADRQTCICPNGKQLKLKTVNIVIRGRRGVGFEGTRAMCQACSLKAKCMRKPDVSPCRQITFFDGSKVKETHQQTKAMKARIDTREGRLLYSRRLGIVEPVFGNLHTKGLRRFTLRSRRKVDAQWKLFAIVHNVEKLRGKAP